MAFHRLTNLTPLWVGTWQTARQQPALLQHLETAWQPATVASIETEADAFALLSLACAADGPLICIPEGFSTSRPIQIICLQTNDTVESQLTPIAHWYGAVLAGENANAAIVLHSVGEPESTTVTNGLFQVQAGAKAQLALTLVQDESRNATSLLATRATLAESATLNTVSVTLGGHRNRHDLDIKMLGKNASTKLDSLVMGKSSMQSDVVTTLRHAVPDSTSRQVHKTILDGDSQSAFHGTIVVAEGAHGTDAGQLNRNLLLSESAKVHTRPQLRIENEDVACAHGATVSQLDAEELFYLASRGLSPESARCVLTFGFADDILRAIPHAALRANLSRRVLTELGMSRTPLSCFTRCEDCTSSSEIYGGPA